MRTYARAACTKRGPQYSRYRAQPSVPWILFFPKLLLDARLWGRRSTAMLITFGVFTFLLLRDLYRLAASMAKADPQRCAQLRPAGHSMRKIRRRKNEWWEQPMIWLRRHPSCRVLALSWIAQKLLRVAVSWWEAGNLQIDLPIIRYILLFCCHRGLQNPQPGNYFHSYKQWARVN